MCIDDIDDVDDVDDIEGLSYIMNDFIPSLDDIYDQFNFYSWWYLLLVQFLVMLILRPIQFRLIQSWILMIFMTGSIPYIDYIHITSSSLGDDCDINYILHI